MAYPTPPSFEPLASTNPVPADTEAMTSLGQQYTKTVNMIKQQVADLQKLTSSTSASWQSKAGSVFVSKASGLASRIEQAEQRYETAATALKSAAGPMYDAQQQAYAAVQQAQEAEQTMKANAPAPPPAAGAPKQTAEQKADAAAAAKKYSAAQDSLSQAQNQFNNAVDAYQTAANNAANAINNELNGDPLTDTWFQQHFGWLLNFFHILAYVVMALAIVALVIACPFTAGFIAGILGASVSAVASVLGTIGTVIDVATAAITVGTAVFDGVGAGEGLESWQSFGLDIFGLATLGLGKGLESFSGSIVKGAKQAVGDTAGQGAYLTTKLGHNNWAAGGNGFVFGSTSGGAQAAAASAKAASEAAVKAVGKVSEGAKGSNLAWLLSSSDGIAKDISSLNGINGLVPGVAKVGAGITKLKGIAGVNGIVQWAGFAVGIWSPASVPLVPGVS
jgi:uncharacterized protein YukE